MRNISRLNAEIKLLCTRYGEENVTWARDYSWVKIDGVELPATLNKTHTNILILIPENYGYGEPIKDCFIDPEIKIRYRGEWREIPHYFPDNPFRNSKFKAQYGRNWRYMCLHQRGWDPKRDTILGYLNQLYTYLSDPFRWEDD